MTRLNRLTNSVLHFLMQQLNLKSMVSRGPRLMVWWRRHVLRRRPVLYHFEVHIADHCNLNCKGCTHFSNLSKPAFATLAAFESDMTAMAEHFAEVSEIFLLGGEPLLHPQLPAFIRAARHSFPRSRLYLISNGILVPHMGGDFWKTLAETRTTLRCSSYPVGLPVEEIERRAREFGACLEWSAPRSEFYKIPIDTQKRHPAGKSFRRCQGYNSCPIVRDGRLYPCAYVAYADVFQDFFGLSGLTPSDADSISIRDGRDGNELLSFLLNPVPWCSHCDSDAREIYTWRTSKRSIDEWTHSCGAESEVDPIPLSTRRTL